MNDPSSAPLKHNRRVAFLIGNCSFPYAPDLNPLSGPQNDVRRLGEIFANPDVGGFEVHSFIDHRSNDILPALEEKLADLGRNDFVLVYYSGHGRLDRSGRLCLASADTRSNAIVNTSIRVRSLTDLLYQSNVGNTLLLLDCCFSGAAGQDLRGSITDELSQHQTAVGHHVFTSSTDTEVSREEVDGQAGEKLGAFTATLIQGLLSGEADTDKDGAIGLQELRTYVQNSLRRQKPQYWGHKTSGDPLIAVNHGRSDNLRIARVIEKLRAWVNDNKLDPVIFVQIVTALQQPETEAEKRVRDILLRLHETRSFTAEAVQLTWKQFVGRTGELPQQSAKEHHRPGVDSPEPEPRRPIHTKSRASTDPTTAPNVRRRRLLQGGAVAAGLAGIAALVTIAPGGGRSGGSEIGMVPVVVDSNTRASVKPRTETQPTKSQTDTTTPVPAVVKPAEPKADIVGSATGAQKPPSLGAAKNTDSVRPAATDKGKATPPKPPKSKPSGPPPKEILADGVQKMENKDYAAAVPVFRKYIALRPTDHEARYFLASSLSEIDSARGAEREYRESIRIKPDYEPSLRELGVRLVHQGRTSEALTLLEKARQLDPDNARTYTHLGIGNVDSDQPAEAARYFGRALELNDKDTEATQHFGALLYSQAALYTQNDSTLAAVTLAEGASALLEPNPQQRRVLAGAYASHGVTLEGSRNYPDAKLYYQKALLVEPYNPLAYSGLLGILHDVEFDFEASFRHAANWMKKFPNDTSRLTEMIEAFVTVGTGADAREIFDDLRNLGLKPESRVVVDAIELISLAASGQEGLLKQRKGQLKQFVSGLPPNLDYHWRFTGTLHYVSRLNTRNRDWLTRLLTGIQSNDHARISEALR